MKRLLFGALALFVCAGCASTSTMGLARTLNKGAVQGWVGLEGGGIIAAPTSGGSAGVGYPMVEGGVRVGASDHVELGARLGFNGIGLEGKFALVRSATMDRGINLSLAPQVGFFGIGVGPIFVGSLTAQLPLLIGIDFGGHELVLGPKLFNQVYFVGVSDSSGGGGGAVVDLLSAGASIGFAIKAGPVRIVPEVSAVIPFFASGAVTGVSGAATGTGVGGVIFQAGIGLLFGSANSYERPEPLPTFEPPPPQPMPYPVQPIPLESPPPPPPPQPVETP